MARLWKNDPATPGGKYLVTRLDGTDKVIPTHRGTVKTIRRPWPR